MQNNDGDKEISNKDIYNLIKNLVKSNEEIQKQNKDIKHELKTFIENTTTEIEKLKKENIELKEEVTKIKERILTIERRNKKYNVVIYGVKEYDELEELEEINDLLAIINSKLELCCKYEDIRDYYRLGTKRSGHSRPILMEVINYKLKINILKNAHKLKGTGIYISKDYTPEDLQKRKVLYINKKSHQNYIEEVDTNKTVNVGASPQINLNLPRSTSPTRKAREQKDYKEENKKKNPIKATETREHKKYNTRNQ